MLIKFLMMFGIFLSSTHAMLSDGIHQPKDYLKFAETQEAFRASCFVYDHFRHILQTGVLITPDIVMTAAHGFEGNVHLAGIIVGFGDTVSHQSPQNYKVKALRTHPRYYNTPFPMQGKYDIVFLKLTAPVQGVQPVPLFEEKVFNQIPPLYVATFGSADIPHGAPVQRRAFVLPETDIFSITGRDPEALYDFKTVMMGSVFFEPNDHLKPVKPHGPERELRTYQANLQWRKLNKPPYALALPGSSGAPVFMNVMENGKMKTYVFGLIQSFSHLSASSFRHALGDQETQHLLKTKRQKLYGHYQSVFCIPYKLYQPIEAYKDTLKTYRLSRHVKNILHELENEHKPSKKKSMHSRHPHHKTEKASQP
jgi:hypothetical protein